MRLVIESNHWSWLTNNAIDWRKHLIRIEFNAKIVERVEHWKRMRTLRAEGWLWPTMASLDVSIGGCVDQISRIRCKLWEIMAFSQMCCKTVKTVHKSVDKMNDRITSQSLSDLVIDKRLKGLALRKHSTLVVFTYLSRHSKASPLSLRSEYSS